MARALPLQTNDANFTQLRPFLQSSFFLFLPRKYFEPVEISRFGRAVSDRDNWGRNLQIAMTRVADREDASFGREGFARLCASRNVVNYYELVSAQARAQDGCRAISGYIARSGKRTKSNARLDSIYIYIYFCASVFQSAA